MPISFDCPHCGRSFCVSDQMGGTQARCKTCGQVLTVPTAPPTSAAVDLWGGEDNPPAHPAPPPSVLPRRPTSKSNASQRKRIAMGIGGGALLVGVLLVVVALLEWGGQPRQVDATGSVSSPEPAEEIVAEPEVETAMLLTFSDDYDWRTVTCTEGGYSVMMPGEPEDVDFTSGRLKSYGKSVTVQDRPGSTDVVASVSYIAMPSTGLLLYGGVEGYLDWQIDRSDAKPSVRILARRRITLDKRSTIELRSNGADGIISVDGLHLLPSLCAARR